MTEIFLNKRNRTRKRLFDPYKNGICSYDLTYLSSNRISRNNMKTFYRSSRKDDLIAS